MLRPAGPRRNFGGGYFVWQQ